MINCACKLFAFHMIYSTNMHLFTTWKEIVKLTLYPIVIWCLSTPKLIYVRCHFQNFCVLNSDILLPTSEALRHLQWRNMKVTGSKLTDKCHVCSTACSSWQQWKQPSSAFLALCGGNSPLTNGLPSQRHSYAQSFPYHNVIIIFDIFWWVEDRQFLLLPYLFTWLYINRRRWYIFQQQQQLRI